MNEMKMNNGGENWSRFDGEEWATLLAAQPQFASFCDFSSLNPTPSARANPSGLSLALSLKMR